MKTTLDSKLKRYAALAGGVTAAATTANAQITYVDIDPDAQVTGNQVGITLDFDGDGTDDVTLATIDTVMTGIYPYGGYNIPYTFTYKAGVAIAGTAASWMASGTSTSAIPANVAQGNAIDSNGAFQGGQGELGTWNQYYLGAPLNTQGGPNTGGNFTGVDGFLGMAFQIAGATHYGWVRCEVTADGEILSVKSYAWEGTAGTGINAGETGSGPVGIADIENFATVNNVNNLVTVTLNTEANDVEAVITNISGQQVHSDVVTSTTTQINLDGFASGIYLVSVKSDKGIVTKRVYVK